MPRARPEAITVLAVLGLSACGADGGSLPATTKVGQAEVLDVGGEVYARECASCHGARGEGQPDWPMAGADGSLPAPPHDASGHSWHHSDAELFDIVTHGGTIYMAKSTMPAYGDRLSEFEIKAVLEFIKTMWGPKERAYQQERTRDWAHLMQQHEGSRDD